MREIKFRAWHRKDKKYIEVLEMDFYLQSITYNDYNCDFEAFDIEQYTGLKDKNGVEIYEGDIVNSIYGNREVYFHIGTYWFGSSKGKNQFAMALYSPMIEYEVIGNIHKEAKCDT